MLGVVMTQAGNVLSSAGNIVGSVTGPSKGFQTRQSVRDEFYATLRQAGDAFKTQGETGAKLLAYMNATFSDLSPSRNYGAIGPTATDLSNLKAWLANPSAPGVTTATDQLSIAGVSAGTGKLFGIPIWLIVVGALVTAVIYSRKK